MKTLLFASILLLVPRVQAESVPKNLDAELEKIDRAPFAKDLQNQSQKVLEGQVAPACESSYEHIFAGNEVRFSLMYGYLDAKGGAADAVLAKTMVEHLELPCKPGQAQVQTCGFQVQKKSDGAYELTRQMKVGNKDKKIVISIFAPAVTWDDRANQDVQRYYFEQKQKSDIVEKAFYQSVQQSQVVFYDGHSRIGTGPGFHATGPIQMAWDALTKKSIQKFLSSLNKSPNLKLLGMFACDSEKLYEKEILNVAPDLGLIVTKEPIVMKEGQQSILGSLNSVLTRKCKNDFAKSTVPASRPEQDIVRVKNFFEYGRSLSGASISQGASNFGTR
jgi:hypothetical protein